MSNLIFKKLLAVKQQQAAKCDVYLTKSKY